MRNQAHLNQTLVNLESRNQYCINSQLAIKVCCGYDEGTTTYEGSRNPNSSGLFLPKIHKNHGITTPENHSELAVRLISRDKLSNQTNKASYSYVAVETLSHPIKQGDISYLSLTKTYDTMKNLTQSPSGNIAKSLYSVILTHKDGSTFDCAVNVSLDRANQIKAEIEQRKARNAFGFHDLETITITSGKGGLYA